MRIGGMIYVRECLNENYLRFYEHVCRINADWCWKFNISAIMNCGKSKTIASHPFISSSLFIFLPHLIVILVLFRKLQWCQNKIDMITCPILMLSLLHSVLTYLPIPVEFLVILHPKIPIRHDGSRKFCSS